MNTGLENMTGNSELIDRIQQELLNSGQVDGSSLMGFSMWGIVAAILFGIIGWSLFRYGRKHGPISTWIYGLLLMIYPYFVSDIVYIISIGISLCILPFIVKFG